MSESARKKQRVSPRESETQDLTEESTMYNHLRQLAGAMPKPSTPYRRASSAGPGPTPGSRRTPNILIRTPGTAARTPRGGPATRPISTRRAAPTTPHAIRALRERANAARTPGQNRRRSGRVQRETPRDTLRDLSRILARDSRPVQPSPQIQKTPRNPALDLEDEEDGPDPAVPRLSMALDDMYEDDSFHDAPPRQSLLPELPADADNGTIQSLEFGRRAISEDPRAMYGGRVSERFGDLTELGIEEEDEYEIDGTFINRRRTIDPDQFGLDNNMDDTTTEMRALTGRRGGRASDVDLGVFGEDEEQDEPTFRFTIPQHLRAQPRAQLEVTEEDGEEEEDVDVEPDPETLLEEALNMVVEEDDEGEEAAAAAALEGEADQTGNLEQLGWESDNDIDGDADLEAYREEASAMDRSLQTHSPERKPAATEKARRQRRELKLSRFGHEYPSFPAATVKRLAGSFAKSQGGNGKISKDTLAALVQATDWFFEQVGEDLAAYAQHAGRKSIEEGDVIALMKRQRQITDNSTSFSLAQKMLPRELLQKLRTEPAPKLKRQKRKRMETIEEEEAE